MIEFLFMFFISSLSGITCQLPNMPRGRPSNKARASALAAVPAIEAIVEAEAATVAAEAAPSPRVSAKAPTTPKVSAKAVASPAKSPKEIVQSPAKLYDMAFEEGDEVMAKWPGMYYVVCQKCIPSFSLKFLTLIKAWIVERKNLN